ncbi:Rieske 2Fe-2S domain-containing protein [Bradyrhizobium sp.]|uniref:Rieske 2Fe-2S domain-containing protein n=1 Tax=Bradyrhizobium sp. TaxID=376 RepID=UPI003C72FD43
MAEDENWVDIGHVVEFTAKPLKRVTAMNKDIAVSLKDGKFGAVSNACNHVGGPLLARVGPTAIISSAPGTIGNSIDVAGLVSLASKRIAFQHIR